MTASGNKFNYFSENQLIKFKRPSTSLFCIARGAFGRLWI